MSSSYIIDCSGHPIYKPLSDQHAEYIKSLVKIAAEKDPEFHIFGSSSFASLWVL